MLSITDGYDDIEIFPIFWYKKYGRSRSARTENNVYDTRRIFSCLIFSATH